MNIIKQHIGQNQYKPIYLLYGAEPYLKKLYRDKLKAGILNGSDEMNCSYFGGKGILVQAVQDIADTMPFFADRRLIIIEESGWFKSSQGFEESAGRLPESTHIVFVESEVDKRGKLYKTVKTIGHISEMNGMDDKNLLLFAASLFQKSGLKVTETALQVFFDTIGRNDMYHIIHEAEKLCCYCLGRTQVTVSDIESICTNTFDSQLFLMIDEMASKKKERALSLYFDLLSLREKPMSILFMILRHFHILLQVKELELVEKDRKVIAAKASVPPFAVHKYIRQASAFTKEQLKNYMEYGIHIEEQIKTGSISENIGVELVVQKLP